MDPTPKRTYEGHRRYQFKQRKEHVHACGYGDSTACDHIPILTMQLKIL
jgi:hypothetical protein